MYATITKILKTIIFKDTRLCIPAQSIHGSRDVTGKARVLPSESARNIGKPPRSRVLITVPMPPSYGGDTAADPELARQTAVGIFIAVNFSA
ncbi:hypothetical protein JTE90_028390 [Oedothorax gibbosus]|uniref:Uncharacterized protein n=1 Tax=Oedothorax gibbosus TaxID=931172 RepID=A0AAV6VDD1_9ARAC|nr:hypothetical protein JTE90_028390 [Oedothorax gibbosus]